MSGWLVALLLACSANAYYVELAQAPSGSFTHNLQDEFTSAKVAVRADTSGALLSTVNAHTVGSPVLERTATLTLQVNGHADTASKENQYHSYGVVRGDFWAPVSVTQFRPITDVGRYEVTVSGSVADSREGHEKDAWPIRGVGSQAIFVPNAEVLSTAAAGAIRFESKGTELVGVSKSFGIDQSVTEHGVVLVTVSGYAAWEEGKKAAYLGVFANGKDSTSTCCAWGKYHTFGNLQHAKWAPVAFTNAIAVKPGDHTFDVKGRSFNGPVTLKKMSMQSVFLPGATVVEKVSHAWSISTSKVHHHEYVRFGDLWARVHAATSGVIALTLNGHVHNAGTNEHMHLWLAMGFFVDGDDCSPRREEGEVKDGHDEDYGKYYTYASGQQVQ
jgi:hypothetical protein